MNAKVGIVVLNYNGKKCLQKTLTSLRELSYSEKQIFVVDNASTDGSLEEAKALFPEFSFLELSYNSGFACGMNAGMKAALANSAEYVWLFNYDALAEPDSLNVLVSEAAQAKKKTLFSPQILSDDGSVWFEGGRINFWLMRVQHQFSSKKKSEAFQTEFLTGCALFLPREAIEEVGLLDEDFFLYYEDADYSVRALEKGFSLMIVPKAIVIHSEESVHNPKKIFYLVYSGLLFFQKHNKPFFSFYQAIYVILRRLKNQRDLLFERPNAKEVERAYREFYGKKSAPFFNNIR